MANNAVYKWEQGVLSNPTGPLFKHNADTYYIRLYNVTDIASNDWLVSTPLPTDIKCDFHILASRLTGTTALNLTTEYSMNLGSGLKSDETTWQSVTGAKETWSVSGGTDANYVLDTFKWDIAENGIAPMMRIAYKNETGGTVGASLFNWGVWLVFPRES